MTLLEYIKKSFPNPNRAVLESLGASDELITYLETTPWNTNINVVASAFDINGGGSGGVAIVGSAIVGVSTVGAGA